MSIQTTNFKVPRRLLQGLVVLCVGFMPGQVTGQQTTPSQTASYRASQSRMVTRSFTEPIEQSVVSSTEAGVVYSALIKEGERVQAGDTMAQLNFEVLKQSRRIAIARSKSTAERDAANSRVQMLLAQKQTMEPLVQGGHVNRFEFDQKTSEYQNAVAELRAAEDGLKLAMLEVDKIDALLSQRIIKSPIDGLVTEIHKKPGEHLSANEPQYATVVRINQLKVRFYLDEAVLDQVSLGQTVTVLVGQHKQNREAVVSFVSPIIDPDSGTGRIEIVIDNNDLELRSGVVCFWDRQTALESSAVLNPFNDVVEDAGH